MKRILLIESSLSGADSVSTDIAKTLVAQLTGEYPGSEVSTLDLVRGMHAYLITSGQEELEYEAA